MEASTEQAAEALDNLATAILSTYSDDRPLDAIWGWNLPPLTRHDLADECGEMAARLRELNPKALDTELGVRLQQLPERLDRLRSASLPNLPGPSAMQVVAQIHDLLSWIENKLPIPPPAKVTVDWKDVSTKSLLPPELLRRLRSIEASLKAIEPRAADIAGKVDAIEAAHEAAENLPTDLQTLQEAREQIEEIQKAVTAASDKAGKDVGATGKALADIRAQDTEAKKLIENIGAAYRVTTTKGLAASFANKAFWLNGSLMAWVVGLLGALYIGAQTASARFDKLESLLSQNTNPDRLWIQLVVALVGIGAPVWFAWIATKQIGQRFRLAEDYGFKASVAKAYEGYRREAARIDPEFEARLFSSALARLEEAPLRLVEQESYGSPWHELTASGAFRKALELIPELKTKYLDIVKSIGASGAVADALTSKSAADR